MTRTFSRTDRLLMAGAVVLVVGAAVTRYVDVNSVLAFVLAGLTIAALASLVGRSVDQLGDRLGPGATGVLQSALGNLPELFVCIFALRAGLTKVVEAAVIGSILANLLLVLGLAFLVGGLRNGAQRFDARAGACDRRDDVARRHRHAAAVARAIGCTPRPRRTRRRLSVFASVVLLLVFVCSVPSSLRRAGDEPER